MSISVNYLAVLVAGIVNMAIGMAWYSSVLFGKHWMKLSGLTHEKLNQMKSRGMGKTYSMSFIAALVMAYVLAHFVRVWGATGVGGALQLAFWTWLGFIATKSLGSILWEDKPTKLYLINVAHDLVSLFVMTLILIWWM